MSSYELLFGCTLRLQQRILYTVQYTQTISSRARNKGILFLCFLSTPKPKKGMMMIPCWCFGMVCVSTDLDELEVSLFSSTEEYVKTKK